MYAEGFVERFTAKYVKDESGCWVWTASTAGKGYGQIKVPSQRRQVYAHRVAYELSKGPIPIGRLVCHTCDNPKCVNPDHLFLGSAKDNLQDMKRKDRHLRGDRNAKAVLTESQVREIRGLSDTGYRQHELAKRFGVSQMTISRIVRGERWTHVPHAG